jgi:hypoxanthine phosphoribosyltransferase
LDYAVRELQKDVEEQAKKTGRTDHNTQFGIFVLHNKAKPKKGTLPEELVKERYWAAETIPDFWVLYHINDANYSANIHGKHAILSSIQQKQRHRHRRR